MKSYWLIKYSQSYILNAWKIKFVQTLLLKEYKRKNIYIKSWPTYCYEVNALVI